MKNQREKHDSLFPEVWDDHLLAWEAYHRLATLDGGKNEFCSFINTAHNRNEGDFWSLQRSKWKEVKRRKSFEKNHSLTIVKKLS